jgi:outer membrane protein
MLSIYRTRLLSVFMLACVSLPAYRASGQQPQRDSLLAEATLNKVVGYALEHQPQVKQALLDQEITTQTIKGRLADWYPQINFVYNYQHTADLQSSVIGGSIVKFGVNNLSAAQFNGTQTLFNRDVLLAKKTASTVGAQSAHFTARTKIDVVVNVTKAFYDVLATSQQIKIGQEDIIRLRRSLKDATSQYSAGVADKTDYKRATILLKNSQALLKSNQEQMKYKEKYLKALMGYPLEADLNIQYDTLQMENEIELDTTMAIDYTKNIDYRIMFTQKELQKANVSYSKWAFLPSANLFGSYILNYQNNNFYELYQTRYPYSFFGATLSLPVFQGGKRTANIQQQKLTLDRLDWDLVNLQNSLGTEYERALAAYKSNLVNYLTLRDNVELAREVYDVIQLQYKNGVRAYLDVTVAETDLRAARINYFNALYQVLSSKMDVQRALGEINY